jgi:hypothetical protein
MSRACWPFVSWNSSIRTWSNALPRAFLVIFQQPDRSSGRRNPARPPRASVPVDAVDGAESINGLLRRTP